METINQDEKLARTHGASESEDIPPCPGAAEAAENAAQIAAMPGVLPGEVVRALKAHPTMATKVVAAIERGLDAQAWFYSKGEKKWINEVDHKTQLAAAKLYIENVEGLPIQRVHTITEKREPDQRLQLSKSPALREALRRDLDEADRLAAEAVQKPGVEKHVGPPSEPSAGG